MKKRFHVLDDTTPTKTLALYIENYAQQYASARYTLNFEIITLLIDWYGRDS